MLDCCSVSPRNVHRPPAPLAKGDSAALLGLAERHGVLPLVSAALDHQQSSLPTAEQKKLTGWRRSHELFTLSLAAEFFRILDRFAAEDIGTLLTKGPGLAIRCYSHAALRQFGDLDLIVRHADIAAATRAMIALGYQPKIAPAVIEAGKVPGEYVFLHSRTKALVELHTERTFRYHPRRIPIQTLFERQGSVTLDGRAVPVLCLEDELVLICIHGAKHFWQRLMWIADVAALVSRHNVDWSLAMACAREVGAERMLHVGLQLSAGVCGASLPPHVSGLIAKDRLAVKIAADIVRRLPAGDSRVPGLLRRARFRIAMRGNPFDGASYLLRLSMSPTEEDWTEASPEQRTSFRDALGRPFRLARKYGRGARE